MNAFANDLRQEAGALEIVEENLRRGWCLGTVEENLRRGWCLGTVVENCGGAGAWVPMKESLW